MIEVELSNIWGSVSLPDLLSGEKDLFDAHMQLRTNVPDGPAQLPRRIRRSARPGRASRCARHARCHAGRQPQRV